MSSVQSVERAVAILRCLAENEAGVTQLADEVGLPKSTVSRLLSTLQGLGAVISTDGGYRIGPLIGELANGTGRHGDLVSIARPFLVRLVEATGEAAGISVLDGSDVLYLDQVAENSAVQLRDWTGARVPPHGVSSGLVLLARAPEADRQCLLAGPLPRLTAHTMTSPVKLRRRLAAVAKRTHEWVYGEFALEINSVAAPVFDGAGRAVAAVHVHGPSYRFPGDRDTEQIAADVVAAAARMSARLGHTP